MYFRVIISSLLFSSIYREFLVVSDPRNSVPKQLKIDLVSCNSTGVHDRSAIRKSVPQKNVYEPAVNW